MRVVERAANLHEHVEHEGLGEDLAGLARPTHLLQQVTRRQLEHDTELVVRVEVVVAGDDVRVAELRQQRHLEELRLLLLVREAGHVDTL